jgi:predicted GH43/DUF377 family glycosyl hydrolase
MKYILSTILLLIFILYGCSNNTISKNESTNDNSGKASLNFRNPGIPANVARITAFLTNSNTDTLSRTLNVLSNSSTSISFIGVHKGKWYLKVIAQDRTGRTVFSGKDYVLIQPGKISKVNLNLIPDNKNTGGAKIIVNWGKPKVNWIDSPNNPIFTAMKNPSHPIRVSTSKIIFDKGIFKMFYLSGYNSGKPNIWYAESTDGIKWKNTLEEPVFERDTRGAWDDHTVGPGAIIKDKDGNYRLYYNGWSTQGGKWQIGLALSTDCIHWHRYPFPVLKANDSNEFKIGVVSVLNINHLYFMYYSSSPRDNYNNMRINLALSNDGIHWQRYSKNPILKPTFHWEGIGVTFPAVIYDNNSFVMIYGNEDRTKFGIAYSKDGKKWEKNSKYEFSNQMTSNKYSQINYPFLIKVNNEYRLYYTATTQGNSLQICLAQASKL